MDDWLIDDDRLSIGRKSVLPGEGFFHPDSFEAEQAEREAADKLDGASVVVVADPDADGLACTALIREALGEGVLLPAGPHELEEAIEWVAEYAEADADVFVCDLCPDSEYDVAALDDLVARTASVSWFDHHQWDEDLAETVEDAGVHLAVGDSDEVCSADVTLAELDYDFDERYAELAAVTRDHDLWIREDPRSDDIADYAYWEDPEEYVAVVAEHGADLPPEVEEYIAERRVEKEALIEKAVERGELREVGEWTVGVTYGRCSQNEVAQQVNGGGHPRAAGCKPDIYDDMLDYAHHWTTRGAVAKQAILDAFERLDPGAEE